MVRPMSKRIKLILALFGWLPYRVLSVQAVRIGNVVTDGVFLFRKQVWTESNPPTIVRLDDYSRNSDDAE